MSASANPLPPADYDPIDPRGFWERYSPNGELPWSSAMSLVLFAFLVLLPVVLITPFAERDPTPPAVDVLYVGEDQDAPSGEDEGFEADAALDASQEESSEEPPEQSALDELEEVPETELPPPDVKPVDRGKELERETEVAQATLNQLAQATEQLSANLSQGEAEGSGGLEGGGTGGRGARVARWVLKFNTRSAKHYLAQLDGLGAEIAFPMVGNKWQYYFNVSSTSRLSEVRDLTSENRLYWVDEKPDSISGVAQELGIAVPPFMIVFLPLPLEDRMLQMELAYQNLREEEIKRTDFEVISRAGGYDVGITRQIPR